MQSTASLYNPYGLRHLMQHARHKPADDFVGRARARFVASWLIGRDSWVLYEDSLRVKKTFMDLTLHQGIISLAWIHPHFAKYRRIRWESYPLAVMLAAGVVDWCLSMYPPTAATVRFSLQEWFGFIAMPAIPLLFCILTPRCRVAFEADVKAEIAHSRWDEKRVTRFCIRVVNEAQKYQAETTWWKNPSEPRPSGSDQCATNSPKNIRAATVRERSACNP